MTELRFPLARQPVPIQIDNGAASAAIAVAKAQEASDDADAAHGDRVAADAAAASATQKALEASNDADAAQADRLAADADAAATAVDRIAVAADKNSAAASAGAAAASEANASGSATNAAASAAGALSSLASLLAKWLGVSAADPTQDGTGDPLVDGALYFSSAVMRLKARVSGAWVIAVNTILSTAGAPSSGVGVDGDFAIDSSAGNLYGPKAAGAWPAAKSLVGPPSSPGGANGNVQFKSGVNFSGSNNLFWDALNLRLGIGTTSPANELEVLGSNTPRIALRSAAEVAGESQELGFQVGAAANSSANTVALIRAIITQADPSALKGELRFLTNSGDTAQDRMILGDNGNVCIGGVSPPEAPLHIDSNAANVAPSTTATPNGAVMLSGVGLTSSALTMGVNGGFGAWLQARSRNSADFFNLSLNPVGGNVGIGTGSAAPGGKLEVIGGWSLLGAGNATDATDKDMRVGGKHYLNAEESVTGLYVFSNVSVNAVSIGGGTSLGNAASRVQFFTAANNATLTGTERMRIDSSGNVGIGTITPLTKLVVSDGTNGIEFSPGASPSYISAIARPTGTYGDLILRARDMSFLAGNTQSLFLKNTTGNVGIGLTSPAVKLDVDGPVGFKPYTVATVPAASTKAGQQIYVEDDIGGPVMAFSDGTDWRRCTDRAVISAT